MPNLGVIADILERLPQVDVHGTVYGANSPLGAVGNPIRQGVTDAENAFRHALGAPQLPVEPWRDVMQSQALPYQGGLPEYTRYGRPIHVNDYGEAYSERSATIPGTGLHAGQWFNVPTVMADGSTMPPNEVEHYYSRHGMVDPVTGQRIPGYDSADAAATAARERSANALPGFARPDMVHSFDPAAALSNAARFGAGGGVQAAGGVATDLADAVSLGKEWAAGNVSTPIAAGLAAAIALPTGVSALRALPDHMWGAPQLGRGPGNEQVGAWLFHGTPHHWSPEPGWPQGKPRYDASVRHTGEGTNYEGAGLYQAQNPEVGQQYAMTYGSHMGTDDFANIYKGITVGGKSLDEVTEALPDNDEFGAILEALTNNFIEDRANGAPFESMEQYIDSALDWMEQQGDEAATEFRKLFPPDAWSYTDAAGPNVYAIDYPDEVLAQMIEGDVPLSQQPADVQALVGTAPRFGDDSVDDVSQALHKLASGKFSDPKDQAFSRKIAEEWDVMISDLKAAPDFSKGDVAQYYDYALSSAQRKGDMLAAAAIRNLRDRFPSQWFSPGGDLPLKKYMRENAPLSEALRDAGYPGIRYLDKFSRRKGEGTYNYVTFAPQDQPIRQVVEVGDMLAETDLDALSNEQLARLIEEWGNR